MVEGQHECLEIKSNFSPLAYDFHHVNFEHASIIWKELSPAWKVSNLVKRMLGYHLNTLATIEYEATSCRLVL